MEARTHCAANAGLACFDQLCSSCVVSNSDSIYTMRPVKVPMPHFVVFCNDAEAVFERGELRLTDAFQNPDGCIELTAAPTRPARAA